MFTRKRESFYLLNLKQGNFLPLGMQLTWIGFYPWQQISEFVTCKGGTNMKLAGGMQNIENRLGYLPLTNKYFPTFHLPCDFILLCQFC